MTESQSKWQKRLAWLREKIDAMLGWFERHVPFGLRLPIGLALVAAGIVGIVVPLLGPWMIPLGLAVAALDIKPVWRWLRGER